MALKSHANLILAELRKGRRTNFQVAARKWGLSRAQYGSAIANLRLRDGITIDSDMIPQKGSRRLIASHQLSR
jgi:hypothetical protein